MAGMIPMGYDFKSQAYTAGSNLASMEENRNREEDAIKARNKAVKAQSIGTGAGVGASAGMAYGAQAGTTVSPGYGTLIGAGIGAIAGYLSYELF